MNKVIILISNFIVKSQLISKKIVKPRILPKNERMNSFLLESFCCKKSPNQEIGLSE